MNYTKLIKNNEKMKLSKNETRKTTTEKLRVFRSSLKKMNNRVMTAMEIAIKDRLETGFRNWNGGYESWLEWCNT